VPWHSLGTLPEDDIFYEQPERFAMSQIDSAIEHRDRSADRASIQFRELGRGYGGIWSSPQSHLSNL
jgi:hypothetical protein